MRIRLVASYLGAMKSSVQATRPVQGVTAKTVKDSEADGRWVRGQILRTVAGGEAPADGVDPGIVLRDD